MQINSQLGRSLQVNLKKPPSQAEESYNESGQEFRELRVKGSGFSLGGRVHTPPHHMAANNGLQRLLRFETGTTSATMIVWEGNCSKLFSLSDYCWVALKELTVRY